MEVPTYDFVTHSRWVLASCGALGCACGRAQLDCGVLWVVFSLAGWQRPRWSTLLTWSSSRGSWFSTARTSGTCSTCGSSWTPTRTCGCPAEVRLCCPRQPLPAAGPALLMALLLPSPVLRDMKRGRDLEQILTQYTTFVKPAFEEFCLPVRELPSLALWARAGGRREVSCSVGGAVVASGTAIAQVPLPARLFVQAARWRN